MKRKPMRAIEIVNHALRRGASQGAAFVGGIPWCYIQEHAGQLIEKHPVKQLKKAPRRKP